MVRMAQWAVIISADRWATERLFHHDTLAVEGADGLTPEPDDEVLVVAAGAQPQVVAVARVRQVAAEGALLVAYTRRSFDQPAPADGLKLDEPLTAVEPGVFRRFADRLGSGADRQTWLVSLDLPIEAETPAEAVRQFWSYVLELGPGELPTFVSPSGDELAMQAFVLGAEANQDPEEDDDDD
jgi:hypothetical protein